MAKYIKRFHCGNYDDVKAKYAILTSIVENVAILTKTALDHQKIENLTVFQKDLFRLTRTVFGSFVVLNNSKDRN